LRRKGKNNPKGHNETRGKINTCKTIHERDEKYPNAKTSIEYGHFEGDTIVGKARKSAIVTLVEKYSKYIVLLKASRKSEDVKEAICKWLSSLHKSCISTITFDRGKEFSKWSDIEKDSSVNIEIYFGDPGSPGQRGLNENSNGIVRKDLPKSTDLSAYSQEELNMINLLISVNGVGPKSAVAMLGALSPSQLALAIATEDIKALSVGQGIGKKIAQRIALELKDKVGADTITTGVELVQKVDVATGERAEALSALMALGFTKNEAENAIKAVFVNGMATEEIISKALKVVK